MKKYLALILLPVLVGAAVLSTISQTRAQVSPAISAYLNTVKNSDWAIMALGALGATPADTAFLKTLDGQTANDYSTYILAITALGKDPRTFGPVDLVAGLKQKASNGQIGDASLISDDFFGVMALRAAGIPSSDALIQTEVAYIKNHQGADGGWGFTATAVASSVDMTAMGIMALKAGGVSATDAVITKAASFLLKAQNNDGGFPLLPGGPSNTESTAWVLSEIYAIGDNPLFWAPRSATPLDYLNARLQPGGYFSFDASTTATGARTSVTSSYAAIALSGKYYPIQTISAPVGISLRIEGKDVTICETQVQARTALDAVTGAAHVCNFTYHIQDTQYGPYLDKINNDEAAGLLGWSFVANNTLPQVGAADYLLKDSEQIVWFFGNWDDKPMRLGVDKTTLAPGGSTIATAEKFDYAKNGWLPAVGAVIKRGSETFTTDGSGRATIAWPNAGGYSLFATASSSIRSSKVQVLVGNGSGQQQALNLSVDVSVPTPPPPPVNNPPVQAPPPPPTIVFGVTGDLNFGGLTPGQSATKNATITNSGTANINTTATVTGSPLFTSYLQLDDAAPASWQKRLNAGTNATTAVKLSIPANYSNAGSAQGSLIFWANPVQ